MDGIVGSIGVFYDRFELRESVDMLFMLSPEVDDE
jgi:hypothetical protein